MGDKRTTTADPLAAVLDGWQSEIVKTSKGPVEIATYGEGPTVLAIHGAMGGYDQSVILAKTTGCDGFRYVAVSRPGYLSTPLASGKSAEAQADLLAALLDAMKVERAGAMAVSGGGPAALQFALRHAGRCWGLVLASSPSRPEESAIPLRFKLMQGLARWPAFGRWLERRTLKDYESVAIRSIPDADLCRRTLDDRETGPLFRALMQSTYHRMWQRLAGTENDIAMRSAVDYPLEQITVPTLLVHGTDDPLLPFEQHAKVAEARIPDSRLIALEEGGHAAIFSHRDEVTPVIADFLQVHAPQAVLV